MLTVAYLANRFPAAVEPYVSEEIGELRRRGVLFARSERERAHGFAADRILFWRQVFASGLRRLRVSRLVRSR